MASKMNCEDIESHPEDIELTDKDKLQPDFSELSDYDKKSTSTDKSSAKTNPCIRVMVFPRVVFSSFFSRYHEFVKYGFYFILLAGYIVYFGIALSYDIEAAIPLVILTSIVSFIVLYELFIKFCSQGLKHDLKECCSADCQGKTGKVLTAIGILIAVGFTIWLLIDIILRNPNQLISLFGFFIILVVCICGSKYPQHINWRPVIWGIAMQFILGLLVLRTRAGYVAIKFIGDQVATFMTYSDAGSAFVFGKDTFKIHFFAFKVLPMIIFFSTVMNMLYYIGLMQWFIGKFAYMTQITLGTSAIESTVAVANIFVGMTEAPLVVRPYLPELTKAEIHSVLTAGLGSIAFSVFGVYVEFGVDTVHLLTACVMSAPASLVVSRMLYPEREKSKFLNPGSLALTSGTNRNIVEAAAAGASMSIKLVANIAANLIAFLALLAFINSVLGWLGGFVGVSMLSFEMICSYLFMPVAFLMGADWEDCLLVGQLFGVKTFLNEFIGFESMKPYIACRLNGTEKYHNGEITHLSERSEVIAIHALCGFCNVSSLGIIIGGLSVLMPTRRKDIAGMAIRSLIGGILTCCMTASIAGLLFIETPASELATMSSLNVTGMLGNVTTSSNTVMNLMNVTDAPNNAI